MTVAAAPPDHPTGPVSVVIPCFRCAATIDRAVESVAAQSVLPAELILVDDASGDDTLPALRRLQQRFPSGWIKIIAQSKNCGAGATRNAGWDAAQSEYIAFLDADDAWYPKKLEIQLNAMSAHPDAALSGHRSVIGPTLADPESADSVPVEKITFRQLLFANRFVTPSVMLKRALPFRFRTGQRHMEDHLLWMQIAASGALVLRLEAQLAITFKPAYGASGLSNDLWLMEKSEYFNYRHLAEIGAISHFSAFAMCVYSTLKFLKRIAVVAARATCAVRAS
jgi:glycosyltransferase involved in cell wall biosynthesis